MKKALLLAIATTVSQCTPAPAGVVANTLYLECRGEPLSGQVAVASVIWNRSKHTGMTLSAVCISRKQFSCWNAGVYTPNPTNAKEMAILSVLEDIERSMESGTFKPTVRAENYYAGKPPYWAKDFKVEKVIGRHTFMVKK